MLRNAIVGTGKEKDERRYAQPKSRRHHASHQTMPHTAKALSIQHGQVS